MFTACEGARTDRHVSEAVRIFRSIVVTISLLHLTAAARQGRRRQPCDCYDKSTDGTHGASDHRQVPRRRRHESAATALGRQVRKLRDAKGWSQECLAEHSDLDRSYIAGIETGGRNPSLKALDRLASALGVKIKDLFD